MHIIQDIKNLKLKDHTSLPKITATEEFKAFAAYVRQHGSGAAMDAIDRLEDNRKSRITEQMFGSLEALEIEHNLAPK